MVLWLKHVIGISKLEALYKVHSLEGRGCDNHSVVKITLAISNNIQVLIEMAIFISKKEDTTLSGV